MSARALCPVCHTVQVVDSGGRFCKHDLPGGHCLGSRTQSIAPLDAPAVEGVYDNKDYLRSVGDEARGARGSLSIGSKPVEIHQGEVFRVEFDVPNQSPVRCTGSFPANECCECGRLVIVGEEEGHICEPEHKHGRRGQTPACKDARCGDCRFARGDNGRLPVAPCPCGCSCHTTRREREAQALMEKTLSSLCIDLARGLDGGYEMEIVEGPRVAALCALVRDYYEENPTGGRLHCSLDDDNNDARMIRWEREEALKAAGTPQERPDDQLAVLIASLLLCLDQEERDLLWARGFGREPTDSFLIECEEPQ